MSDASETTRTVFVHLHEKSSISYSENCNFQLVLQPSHEQYYVFNRMNWINQRQKLLYPWLCLNFKQIFLMILFVERLSFTKCYCRCHCESAFWNWIEIISFGNILNVISCVRIGYSIHWTAFYGFSFIDVKKIYGFPMTAQQPSTNNFVCILYTAYAGHKNLFGDRFWKRNGPWNQW